MTTYAQYINDKWVALQVGAPVISPDGEYQASFNTVVSWTTVEQIEFGVYVVEESPDTPEGQVAVPGDIVTENGKPVRNYTYITPEPTTPPVYITFKSDIVRRTTDDEADQLDAALNDLPSKLRLLYNGVQTIEHNSPEFPILISVFTGLFGATRANELLAPSEG